MTGVVVHRPGPRAWAALLICELKMVARDTAGLIVPIGLSVFFVLGATGGMFGGPDSLPEAIAAIGRWLPFGAGSRALSAAWIGAPVEASSLIGLACAVVFGGVVAAVFFRWD